MYVCMYIYIYICFFSGCVKAGLLTLLMIGITPIRPFRGIISRVISTVIIG